MLLAFHAGSETRHLDEMLGVRVDLDFYLHPVDVVARHLESAGLIVDAQLVRRAYEPLEVATQRAYAWARKPGTA